MRKIYISCGSNKGGEFIAFKESNIYSDDFIIYAFEPEPRCFPFLEEHQKTTNNLIHIKKGISTENGTATFNIGNLTVSGTLRDDKTWGLTGKTLTIETIDFCAWLEENIKEDDYVILTMDIEGTEYDILPKMFETNTVRLINKMYVEFHGNKMKRDTDTLEAELKEKLIATYGKNFFARFVEGNPTLFKKAHPDLDPNMFNNIGTLD